jgi:multiple sugar transport system ATP-binding protein
MAKLTIRDISKSFGAVSVLRGVSLDVQESEFLTLLGPSGCGKSTLLRIIAGLEPQDDGSVAIGDQVVDHWRPKDRDVAMVFQSYALYPHMTVASNLALPLQMRRLTPAQRLPFVGTFMPGSRARRAGIAREVQEVAKSLELADLLDRKPGQLSGGQRQRVALARAMVRHPAVFLMDEPLSNLDAKLRAQMRAEIVGLRRKLEATFVYVTHDQTEAMTMSDRVAVMFDGKVAQVGSPQALYSQPATRQVAEFIGSPRINMIDGIVRPGNVVEAADALVPITCELPPGTPVTLGLRPEALNLTDHKGPGCFTGRIQRVENMGSDLFVYFHVLGRGEPVVVRTSPQQGAGLRVDAMIHVAPMRDLVLVFDCGGGVVRSGVSTVTRLRHHRLP